VQVQDPHVPDSYLELFPIFLFWNWKKMPFYADKNGPGIVKRVNWGPTRTAADIRWLADNPKWLFDNNKTIDIRIGSIEDINLRGLSSATVPRFSDLSIKNVIFDRANLPGVTFSKTNIADVQFREATLNFATFTESTVLTRTSFNQADLTKATFDGVRFCAGVDFSDAIVTDASFDVIFFNNNVAPNMKDTAWWLAKNWNEDQRKLLAEKYPGAEIENSLQFKKELTGIQANLDLVENSLKDVRLNQVERETLLSLQALWMNQKAWAFAKYGVVRPNEDPKLDGEKMARESIRIVDELIDKPDRDPQTLQSYRYQKAMVNDPLAYIIIQREGSPSQRLNEAIDRLESARDVMDDRQDREVYFKLAIALNIASKDEPKAAAYLKKSVQEKGYVPSHEVYLLAEFITQPFREIIANSKTAKATPSKNAAVDDPGVQQKNSNPCEAGQSSQNSK